MKKSWDIKAHVVDNWIKHEVMGGMENMKKLSQPDFLHSFSNASCVLLFEVLDHAREPILMLFL